MNFSDDSRSRVDHEKDGNRSLEIGIGEAISLRYRNDLMTNTTVPTMFEWSRRRWDDQREHERMVPLCPYSFGSILVKVHFRDGILTVFTAVYRQNTCHIEVSVGHKMASTPMTDK